MQINRRDFVKSLGAGAAVALIAGATSTSKSFAAATKVAGNSDKAMLYDSSKCVGCRACQNACKQWNHQPAESIGYNGIYDNPQDLSPDTWTLIKYAESDKDNELLLCKYQCMHCTQAACVKVCPTGALTHHAMGFVNYNKDLCCGCGYCREFCPFHIPQIEGNTITGKTLMEKCTFCQDRVSIGQPTACSAACPAGALIFGDRSDLVALGKQRAATLKSSYPGTTFYGEKELGGLHVLYVLTDLPEMFKFPTDPEVPQMAFAWQDVIQPIGWAVGGLTILGLGLNYLVARASKNITKEK
jgi:formate dehydrogenase iron-sulfur subunit